MRARQAWFWMRHPYRWFKGRASRKAFREEIRASLQAEYNRLFDKEMEKMFGGGPNHRMGGFSWYLDKPSK